jgi:serine/threonine protein kinase
MNVQMRSIDYVPDFKRLSEAEPICGHRIISPEWRGRNSALWLAEKDGHLSMFKWIRPSVGAGMIRAEIEANRRMADCPYAVAATEIVDIEGSTGFFMPYYKTGDLHEFIRRSGCMDLPTLARISYPVVMALKHMHDASMVHRDVKPENILLSDRNGGVLCDFGLSSYLGDNGMLTEPLGTLEWAAPQVIQGLEYDCSIDMWSFGATLFYLATGRYPFPEDRAFTSVEESILSGTWDYEALSTPDYGPEFDPLRDLIGNLLQVDPEARLTAEDVMAHPFYSEVGPVAAEKGMLVAMEEALDAADGA